MHHSPRPARSTDHEADQPTAWAGGRSVVVPGLGVGRLLSEGPPRVVEVSLGAPVAGVFVVECETGAGQVIVVADPGVEPEQLDRLIASAEVVNSEAPAVVRRPAPVPRQRRTPGTGTASAIAWFAGAAAVIGAGLASAEPSIREAALTKPTASAESSVREAAYSAPAPPSTGSALTVR